MIDLKAKEVTDRLAGLFLGHRLADGNVQT